MKVSCLGNPAVGQEGQERVEGMQEGWMRWLGRKRLLASSTGSPGAAGTRLGSVCAVS